MNLFENRHVEIGIAIAIFTSPLIFWLALYCATKWSSIDLGFVLPCIKALRWIGWGLAGALFIYFLMDSHSSMSSRNYAFALFGASAGFAMPQNWLTRHLERKVTSEICGASSNKQDE